MVQRKKKFYTCVPDKKILNIWSRGKIFPNLWSRKKFYMSGPNKKKMF